MTFPFPTIRVAGNEALARLAQLQASDQGYPVILGNAEALEQLEENLEHDEGEPVEQLIAAARAIDPLAWLAATAAEYAEDDEDEGAGAPESGEWPDDVTPSDGLVGHIDTLKGTPYPEIVIGLIPADEGWMVPCHLRVGGWNACPDAAVHAAMFKRWGEQYGARVVTVGPDIIELQVERPPETREQALALAREQYWYCPDIVDQGTETLEVLAATLLGGKAWFFWWD